MALSWLQQHRQAILDFYKFNQAMTYILCGTWDDLSVDQRLEIFFDSYEKTKAFHDAIQKPVQ